MEKRVLDFFERKTYGVCDWLAPRMGLQVRSVRLSFIYLSFLTFGSPIFVYLILMFWKKNNHVFRPVRRRTLWDRF